MPVLAPARRYRSICGRRSRQPADLAEQHRCRDRADGAWRRRRMTQIQSIAVELLRAAQQRGRRRIQRGGHHRGVGARRAEAGRGPAGYPGRRRLRVRRPGYRQPAGARSRQHTDVRLLHADQHGGAAIWTRQRRRRRPRPRHSTSRPRMPPGTSPFSAYAVAAIRDAAGAAPDRAGGSEPDRSRSASWPAPTR